MSASTLTDDDWRIRLYVYRFFVEQARPPTTQETAQQFRLPEADVRAAYRRLHDGHALVLTPGSTEIRMANPLSAVPTPFEVTVNGRRLFANCAWDSLGIPAMLHADARVEASYSDATGAPEPARYAVVGGELQGDGGVVHFPLPFRRWYEDLIHT